MSIKDFFMERLPSTRRFVERRLNEQDAYLLSLFDTQQLLFERQEKILTEIDNLVVSQEHIMTQLDTNKETILKSIDTTSNKYIQIAVDSLDKEITKNKAEVIKDISDEIDKIIPNITDFRKEMAINQIDMKEKISRGVRAANEATYASIFHDTVINSTWLTNKQFSPGRWALGYPGLYVLYRILDEIKPQNILEMGLGQSTAMITQYAASRPEVKHFVTEHDDSWIDFFQKTHYLSENTNILRQNIIHSEYKDDKDVLAYSDFEETLPSITFDCFFVDAPLGGLANIYARVDILKIIPEYMDDSFVIMVDDYNRNGERRMVSELITILDEAKIKYRKGEYSGVRDTLVIASENYKWVCTL